MSAAPAPEPRNLIGATFATPGRTWKVESDASAILDPNGKPFGPGYYAVRWTQDASSIPEGAEALSAVQVWTDGVILVYLDAEEAKRDAES